MTQQLRFIEEGSPSNRKVNAPQQWTGCVFALKYSKQIKVKSFMFKTYWVNANESLYSRFDLSESVMICMFLFRLFICLDFKKKLQSIMSHSAVFRWCTSITIISIVTPPHYLLPPRRHIYSGNRTPFIDKNVLCPGQMSPPTFSLHLPGFYILSLCCYQFSTFCLVSFALIYCASKLHGTITLHVWLSLFQFIRYAELHEC